MTATWKRCCALSVVLCLASALQAEMVVRRWGTAPKGPPGRKRVVRARAKPPTGYVAETKAAPTVDGKLTDRAWAEALPLSLSQTLDGTRRAAQPTEVKLLHDGRMLYLAFRCTEPQVAKARASRRSHDGEVWSDESVEFFLGSGGVYHHFAVNAAGSMYDGRMKDGSWNSGMRAAVSNGRNRITISR